MSSEFAYVASPVAPNLLQIALLEAIKLRHREFQFKLIYGASAGAADLLQTASLGAPNLLYTALPNALNWLQVAPLEDVDFLQVALSGVTASSEFTIICVTKSSIKVC